MRKAREFVVYPGDSARITVRSDRAIGRFDPRTREGVLNWKGSNAKYFPHLLPQPGAEAYTFPQEFVEACLEARLKNGEEIGPGVTIGGEQ